MKTNGFTLIELLAVIVILAIIALIASPIIIGLIDDARHESFKASSYGIIDSAETGFAKTLLNQEQSTITEYEYNNGVETKIQGNISLNYNGKKPNSGTLLINTEGKVAIAFYENGYCASKGYNDTEITLEEIEEGSCVIPGADTTPPEITILGDNPIYFHVCMITYNDPGATALDNVDGDLTSQIVVNEDVYGTHTVTYTVTDTAGNEATATRTMNYDDGVCP